MVAAVRAVATEGVARAAARAVEVMVGEGIKEVERAAVD
jgi:hypothetical protein